MNIYAISALCIASMAISAATPAQHAVESGIGYQSVEAALEALGDRPDVRISLEAGWTVIEDPRTRFLWSFTPPSHPAHPTTVRRRLVQSGGEIFIEMQALCQAEKAHCDRLMAEFQEVNNRLRLRAGLQSRSQLSKAEWSPSEQQKTRAMEVLSGFLQARDEGRYKDVYDMFAPKTKRIMSFDRFVLLEEHFQKQSGGEPARTGVRITWYKDPPDASTPGVYAAFNIRCTYKNISICEEVFILHEQSDGNFVVTRQERNFVDKESERKLRHQVEKRQPS